MCSIGLSKDLYDSIASLPETERHLELSVSCNFIRAYSVTKSLPNIAIAAKNDSMGEVIV